MIRLLLILLPFSFVAGERLNLSLPTDNRAIFEDRPEDYYMWIRRGDTKAWTAGQYGFVRDLRPTKHEGIIATKFHEGLDIKPTARDKNARPLDLIKSIAPGVVAYVNANARGSNYGKYVVVEHRWTDGLFYSLYAHLSEITAKKGEEVQGGAPLGKMGYTGAGLNRERAHLHLELCLLATTHFDQWHEDIYGTRSSHANCNGLNLIGIDVASLFLAEKNNPDLSISTFLDGATPYFKVAIPRSGPLEILNRYPWLKKGNHEKSSSAWELSFTDSGIPLSVAPSNRVVKEPTVTYVRTTRSKHSYYTQKRLVGEGRRASLSKRGLNFIALFTTNPNPE